MSKVEIFDSRAATYDNLSWTKESIYMDESIKALDIQTGYETILDIGPGTAPVMRELLKTYPNLNLIFVEPSSGMIEKISDFCMENNDKNYCITVYNNFDFLKNANDYVPYIFDRVLMRNVLHHFESSQHIYDTLSLICDYTKKTGKIVIGDGCPPFIEEVFDGCAKSIHMKDEDIELSQNILKIKEDRLNWSQIDFAISTFFQKNNIPYSYKFISTPHMSIDNWLDNGLVDFDKINKIREIICDMNTDQKLRFGVTEEITGKFGSETKELFWNFNHIVYTA